MSHANRMGVLDQTLIQLASLRRLYHHVANHGKWDYSIDNRRLSAAINRIEKQHAEIQALKASLAECRGVG